EAEPPPDPGARDRPPVDSSATQSITDCSDGQRARGSGMIVRVERHAHGPRLYLAGRRVHEWHLGALLLAAGGLALTIAHRGLSAPTGLLLLVGGWMVVKD